MFLMSLHKEENLVEKDYHWPGINVKVKQNKTIICTSKNMQPPLAQIFKF